MTMACYGGLRKAPCRRGAGVSMLEMIGVGLGVAVIAAVLWNLRGGPPPDNGNFENPPTHLG